MSWKDRLSDKDLLEMLATCDVLDVYTTSSLINEVSNWVYDIRVENFYRVMTVKEASGTSSFCDCKECKSFGDNLFEYHSIKEAVDFAYREFPEKKIIVWLNSELLYKVARHEILVGPFQCEYLNSLFSRLGFLTYYANVRYCLWDFEEMNEWSKDREKFLQSNCVSKGLPILS